MEGIEHLARKENNDNNHIIMFTPSRDHERIESEIFELLELLFSSGGDVSRI